MNIAIGIDTGGTCTDAVIYDYDQNKILCKAKDLTTKEDLSIGISKVLDKLPEAYLKQANILSLSTTLATNACVEDMGSHAKLILIGAKKKTLEWIDIETNYGIKLEDTLCIDHDISFDSNTLTSLDFDQVIHDHHEWLEDAQAISVVGANAIHNGSVDEKAAFNALNKVYDVPIVLGSDLVNQTNMIERGATALLNAKLLPTIHDFMDAVNKVMKARSLNIPTVIVRSDGSLMSQKASRRKPVDTILCGPAASVLGGKALTNVKNALIIDIGGTTTDISIIKNKQAEMVNKGINIGGWRTQVKGIFIDTFALGGDSAIRMEDDQLVLSNRRVLPLCSAASRWPEIMKDLAKLMDHKHYHNESSHEFLFLIKMPTKLNTYSENEISLLRLLEKGPFMLGNAIPLGISIYEQKTERLEREGYIMFAGLTPTDIMHINGDYNEFNKEASILGARYFLNYLTSYEDNDLDMKAFTKACYDMIKKSLFINIIRVFLSNKYPSIYGQSLGQQTLALIENQWENRHLEEGSEFFSMQFSSIATLVGIGAPTYLFLPDVAKALGTKCIIPEHAEVANAIGAAIADVSVNVKIDIRPKINSSGILDYRVYGKNIVYKVESIEEATEIAHDLAIKEAKNEARLRGSLGQLSVDVQSKKNIFHAKDGQELDFGFSVIAAVTGRIG